MPARSLTTSLNSAVSRYPQTRVSTLQNGIRVASETVDGDAATVGVFIDAGSRFETEENNGVAHFLEHMMFKGTNKRSRHQLESEIENLGATLNAYTSRESTVYYCKVQKPDVNQTLDILSDMMLNSKIADEAVHAERHTILREAEEISGNMQEVIFDRLHETAYRGSSMARTILGSSENIQRITSRDISRYVRQHYTGPRIVIAGAGGVQHEALVASAEKFFSSVPAVSSVGRVVRPPADFVGSDILVRDDDMPYAHIAYGFETAGARDKDYYSLVVLQYLIDSFNVNAMGGEYLTSPIAGKVARENLAQSLTPFNTLYSDTGLFGMYLVADAMKLNELMHHVPQLLIQMSYNLRPEQLDEAKNKAKLAVLAQLDGSTPTCEDIGRQMITFGRRVHPIEAVARIDAIDIIQVQNVIRRFMYDKDHALAAVGPIYELPDYNFIRRRAYSNRL